MIPPTEPLKANLIFLARDPLLETNKPYELLYDTPPLPRGCNFDEVNEEAKVQDFRPLKGKLLLDEDGFLLVDLPREMPCDDFFDERLREAFVREAKRLLIGVCGARAVYVHECVVCDSFFFVSRSWDCAWWMGVKLS